MQTRFGSAWWRITALLGLGVALGTGAVQAGETVCPYEQPALKSGTVYEAGGTNRVLFHFRRTVVRNGAQVEVVREFTTPAGTPAARERMVYAGNRLVSLDLEELQIDARGTVTVRREAARPAAAELDFAYVTQIGTRARTNRNTEPLRGDALANDMIAPFIAAHWRELQAGQTVKFRYLAAARAETVGFEFTKQEETTRQGRPVVRLKMAPSSYLIAALVDPLYFMVERDGAHRVLEYEGRTTPKRDAGGKFKDLDALTVFHWE